MIAKIDSDGDRSDGDNYGTHDPLRLRRGSDPNAENYQFSNLGSKLPPKSPLESSKMGASSKPAKRKRKRLTRRRMAELPNFDVEEILGEFEVDE